MPASKLAKIGVWEDEKFIGAIIFGGGATSKLVAPYGYKQEEGCELVRVALDKHDAPVSKIMAIAIRMIKRKYPRLQLIVSFADPREGHRGAIYQAGNWIYTGTTPPDRFPILDGRICHPRTLSDKIKRGEIVDRKKVSFIRTPGKHRYLYPLTQVALDRVRDLIKPYPKASDTGAVQTPAEQRQFESDPDAPISDHGRTETEEGVEESRTTSEVQQGDGG